MKLKCNNPECLHEWDCKSDYIKVTCPSCGNKVKNIARTEKQFIKQVKKTKKSEAVVFDES